MPTKYRTLAALAASAAMPLLAHAGPGDAASEAERAPQAVPAFLAKAAPVAAAVAAVPEAFPPPARGALPDLPMGSALPEGYGGQCLARVRVAAVFQERSEPFTAQEAHTRTVAAQADFEDGTERVVIKQASTRYIVRQPLYGVETEEVVVRPEYTEIRVIPARFETQLVPVEVTPPRKVWKLGAAGSEGETRVDPATGAVFRLVEMPAETERVRKKVMVEPERVEERVIPAQTVTVTRRVVKDPGGVEEIAVPARYAELPVKRLVRDASAEEISVPARQGMVAMRDVATPERYDWVPVLCDDDATPQLVAGIQARLAESGDYEGRVDGIAGPQTMAALRSFQARMGLPHRGLLTGATLRRLGAGDAADVAPAQTVAKVGASSTEVASPRQLGGAAPDNEPRGPAPAQGGDPAFPAPAGPIAPAGAPAGPAGAPGSGGIGPSSAPGPVATGRRRAPVPAMQAGISGPGIGALSVHTEAGRTRPALTRSAPQGARRLSWSGKVAVHPVREPASNEGAATR